MLMLTLQAPLPVFRLTPSPNTKGSKRLSLEAAKIYISAALSRKEEPTFMPDITQAGHARCVKQGIRNTPVKKKRKEKCGSLQREDTNACTKFPAGCSTSSREGVVLASRE